MGLGLGLGVGCTMSAMSSLLKGALPVIISKTRQPKVHLGEG